MRITKFILIVTMFIPVTTNSVQSILVDYFKRNKDSLAIEITKLINMSKSSFKTLQPSNIVSEILEDVTYESIRHNSEAYQFIKQWFLAQ